MFLAIGTHRSHVTGHLAHPSSAPLSCCVPLQELRPPEAALAGWLRHIRCDEAAPVWRTFQMHVLKFAGCTLWPSIPQNALRWGQLCSSVLSRLRRPAPLKAAAPDLEHSKCVLLSSSCLCRNISAKKKKKKK